MYSIYTVGQMFNNKYVVVHSTVSKILGPQVNDLGLGRNSSPWVSPDSGP